LNEVRARVSVVIPTYNAANFISRTIESVIAQSYGDLEVVVVDDGSSDGTPDIVAGFGDRVRLIVQPNGGVSTARNRAIREARGELIAFLDHDDIWYQDKLRRQVSLLDSRADVGLVYANADFIDEADEPMWTYLARPRLHRGRVLSPLFLDCFIPLLTVVVRSKLLTEIGQFESRWHIAEDYDLFLRAAERTEIDYVDDVLAGYRIHRGNLSKDFTRRLREEQEVLAASLARNPRLRDYVGDSAIRLRMAGLRCEYGHALLFQGKLREASSYFGRRMPGQLVASVFLWAAGRLGPKFVVGARRIYRQLREGASALLNRLHVQRPIA
jgi:glycosyltransferase involved in cell wall biosynthesis